MAWQFSRPMVAVGCVQSLMTVGFGSVIDRTARELSSFAAVACGQVCASAVGMAMAAEVSAAQPCLPLARRVKVVGKMVSVAAGGVLGLLPLLAIHPSRGVELRRRQEDEARAAAALSVSISNDLSPNVTTADVRGPLPPGLAFAVADMLARDAYSLDRLDEGPTPEGDAQLLVEVSRAGGPLSEGDLPQLRACLQRAGVEAASAPGLASAAWRYRDLADACVAEKEALQRDVFSLRSTLDRHLATLVGVDGTAASRGVLGAQLDASGQAVERDGEGDAAVTNSGRRADEQHGLRAADEGDVLAREARELELGAENVRLRAETAELRAALERALAVLVAEANE